jgi:hypothetical protein
VNIWEEQGPLTLDKIDTPQPADSLPPQGRMSFNSLIINLTPAGNLPGKKKKKKKTTKSNLNSHSNHHKRHCGY